MAIYLGSELVNFNTAHDVKQYAHWVGGSYSIVTKSTSTKMSGVAKASVYAPEGCSIYASQFALGSSALTYSTGASDSSVYHRVRAYVYSCLCDVTSARVANCSQYCSEVMHSKSIASTSSIFAVGAAVNAFAITDTVIKNSTLMYSHSTGVQSFFTGLITPFTKVSASLLQTVPSEAFERRSNLTAVNFPMCTSIGDFAFYSCDSLATISFPVCTNIGYNAFFNCQSLTAANFPVCTTIESSAFRACSSLTTISFPVCTSIGYNGFSGCRSLATASFPTCDTIGSYAFAYCSNLATISFPVCTTIGIYAFSGCQSLTAVNFPMCSIIKDLAFTSCYNLISLNLTNVSSVPILSGTNVFSSTPIGGYSASAGQFGSIYVPASLYSDFLVAENWSDVSSRIVSV